MVKITVQDENQDGNRVENRIVNRSEDGAPTETALSVEDADSAVVVNSDTKLLILHFREIPADIQHRHYFDHLCGAADANNVQLPPCIVLVGDNISLSALNENTMEELGWVRKEKG